MQDNHRLSQRVGIKEIAMVLVIVSVLIVVATSRFSSSSTANHVRSYLPSFLDRQPERKSIYEMTNMSESEFEIYTKELEEKMCRWVAREYRRNPGFRLSIRLDECKDKGIIQ